MRLGQQAWSASVVPDRAQSSTSCLQIQTHNKKSRRDRKRGVGNSERRRKRDGECRGKLASKQASKQLPLHHSPGERKRWRQPLSESTEQVQGQVGGFIFSSCTGGLHLPVRKGPLAAFGVCAGHSRPFRRSGMLPASIFTRGGCVQASRARVPTEKKATTFNT